MLAVWKEWKLDILLKKLYDKGKMFCGVSAGAICWYNKGITDSWASNLSILDCLGFINEVNCPHYYGEKDRQPSVHAFINDNKIDSCFASEDGSALHYKGGELIGSITFYKGAKSYFIHKKSNKIVEEVIEGIDLNN